MANNKLITQLYRSTLYEKEIIDSFPTHEIHFGMAIDVTNNPKAPVLDEFGMRLDKFFLQSGPLSLCNLVFWISRFTTDVKLSTHKSVLFSFLLLFCFVERKVRNQI